MLAEADAPAKLDDENPWPGLLSFTEDGQAFFHGRDADVAELLRLVQRQTLTVLFGESGLGKTSLLSAGLFPLLREQEFLPVYIRLALHEAAAPPVQQVWAALAANLGEHLVEGRLPQPGETLWGYFHDRATDFWDARSRLITPVLVFDQFEEVFTVGRGMPGVQELRDQLAELVENRTPASVKQALEDDPDGAGRFDFSRTACKVILSFREDFLPQFESFRGPMPASAGERMRLQRLNGWQARDAILLSGGHLVAEGVADGIIAFVAGERHAEQPAVDSSRELAQMEIDPALLSLFCRELNNKRRSAGLDRITADLLADEHDEIIAEFYRTSVADLGAPVRRFIEDHLLTSEGFRNTYALDDALRIEGVTRAAIDTLVTRRLLRLEEYSRSTRIELTHDVLTKVIREERNRRQEGEAAQLRVEQAEAEARSEREQRALQQRLVAEAEMRARTSRRQVKKARRVVGLLAFLCALAVGASVWAWFQTDKAIDATKTAIAATKAANDNAAQARVSDQTAQANLVLAQRRQAQAEANLDLAIKGASKDVETVSNNSLSGAITADVARTILENARDAFDKIPDDASQAFLEGQIKLFMAMVFTYRDLGDYSAMLETAKLLDTSSDRLAKIDAGALAVREGWLLASAGAALAYASLGDPTSGMNAFARASSLLQAPVGQDAPLEWLDYVSYAHFCRARLLFAQRSLPEAEAEDRLVIDLLKQWTDRTSEPPSRLEAYAHIYLAKTLVAEGDSQHAVQELQSAQRLIQLMRNTDSSHAALRLYQAEIDSDLADVLFVQGDLTEAQNDHQHARSFFDDLLERKYARVIEPYANWMRQHATAMRMDKDFATSLTILRQIDDDLAGFLTETNYSRFARQLSLVLEYSRLDRAAAHLAKRLTSQSRSEYADWIRVSDQLAAKYPSDPEMLALQSAARFGLGDVEQADGNAAAARDAYDAGLAILRPLVAAHPFDATWRHDLATAESKVAMARLALGETDAGVANLHAAEALLVDLTKKDPMNRVWATDLAEVTRHLGAADASNGPGSQPGRSAKPAPL